MCLKFEDAIDTYPFEEDYAILRHKTNNKWFGVIFELDGKLCINLKCDPVESAFLRDMYEEIKPAWHMNKVHWIMVEVSGVDKDLLENLVQKSYNLTKQKVCKKKVPKDDW